MIRKLLLLAPLVLVVPVAEGQCPNGRCRPAAQYRARYVQAPTVTYAPADPASFGTWLNAVRAQYGRAPLAYDPALASLAAANSSLGFGHNGVFSGYEAVAMGTLGSAEAQWMSSPAHLAVLLAPGVRTYGIACVGNVTTFTAR